MKKIIVAAFILTVIVILGLLALKNSSRPGNHDGIQSVENSLKTKGDYKNMKLESSAFAHNQDIPVKYTCDGENISPPLKISGTPESAKSLVLIVDDPDAPGGTWVHWTVWNITSSTEEMAESSVPDGAVEGVTDFGNAGYGGPCPPSGTHRYFFKLYALDAELDLPSGASISELRKAMQGHIIAKAELVGLYSRS